MAAIHGQDPSRKATSTRLWQTGKRTGEFMDQTSDRAPSNGDVEPQRQAGWRRWKPSETTAWILVVVVPIALFVFTQLDFVQNARGWFIKGLTDWDLGKMDIVADIVAPIWVVSLVAVAALERRMLRYYADSPSPPEATPVPILTPGRVYASTWIATAGAGAIVLMSWSREWVRFNEQPDAFWYVLTILFVLAMVFIPVWWERRNLFGDVHDAIVQSKAAHRIDVYLFGSDDRGGQRWLILFSFAVLTAFIVFTALSQFDALLKGMHPSGGSSVGMNGLASVFEFDLSQKPDQIIERVGSWVAYAADVGPGFATGHAVATGYLALDSLVMIPAYTICIGILLLHVRRTPPDNLSGETAGSYGLVNGVGFLALGVLVAADLFENLMTWVVIDSAWSTTPATLGSWTVRLMWFASLFRTLALFLLISIAVLSLAFRASRYRWLGDALVSVRGQILVVVFIVAVLGMAQMEDVVRRWTVSVAFLTVAMVTALAVLVQWTSASAFARLRGEEIAAESGDPPEPTRVRLPWRTAPTSLRTVIVASVFGIAAVQVVVVGTVGMPAGLGFVVPSAMIAILWMFGIPLPDALFRRGDRSIDPAIKRWFPKILGAAVYLTLGIVVIRAATTQLVFAHHVDPWLLFGFVPLLLGAYRIHTKTWSTMGGLELVVVSAVSLFGVALWITRGDPELSPVALIFLGLLITYSAMPFYYSYDAASLPSRFVRNRLSGLRIQPLIIAGGTIALITSLAIVIRPLSVPARIGTVAVVLLGSMFLAGFAAIAVAYAEATRPPKIVAAFGLKRTPVFIFMFVWVALAGVAATGASNEVTVQERTGSTEPGSVVIDDVWDRWVSRNATEVTGGEAIPIVFIASSGGGLRAAAWSSYIMDCLFIGSMNVEACRPAEAGADPVVVMSGVSGGSLGLAAWTSAVVEPAVTTQTDDWVKDRLGDDYLAGAMAWLLLVDTPRSFLGFGPSIRDRAEIMELTWEASWDSNGGSLLSLGMFDLWDRHTDMPLMVFNGTSVNDPCRFNASVLSATAHDADDTCTSLSVFEGRTTPVPGGAALAATKDLADYLCPGQDIKVSTAALMSARFPVITPSGRIGGSLVECTDDPISAFVVDGGYNEGSGAGTVTELWQRLEPNIEAFNQEHDVCIVPFLIQIDNGYENPGAAPAGSSPIEVLVPIRTLLASQFGRIANAREQAAIEFDRPLDVGGRRVVVTDPSGTRIVSRYARITTRAHPGVQAPLGWTLSNASFDDLRSQLTIEENRAELVEIQRWLNQPLTCRDEG